MWFKYSMSIAQQLIPIYNTTVHKNKTNVALNVVKLFVPKVNQHQQATGAETPSMAVVYGNYK